MKFKVLKGTDLFNDFINLDKRLKDANKARKALANKIKLPGFKITGTSSSSRYAAGSINAFQVDKYISNKDQLPAGWKAMERLSTNWIFPKSEKSNKELLKSIYDLPTVDRSDVNDIIKFAGMYQDNSFSGSGIRFINGYALSIQKDYILIDTDNTGTQYKPLKDMIEILDSEYEKLKPKK